MDADWLDGCHFLDACHWPSLTVMTVRRLGSGYTPRLIWDHLGIDFSNPRRLSIEEGCNLKTQKIDCEDNWMSDVVFFFLIPIAQRSRLK